MKTTSIAAPSGSDLRKTRADVEQVHRSLEVVTIEGCRARLVGTSMDEATLSLDENDDSSIACVESIGVLAGERSENETWQTDSAKFVDS